MAETFLLEIVTPLGVLLSDEVAEVTAPGEKGEFGVLKSHTEFVTTLVPGRLSYASGKGGAKTHMAVGSGFAEVLPEKTTVLVDAAFAAEDIDLSEAKSELAEAEKALEAVGDEDPDHGKLEAARLLARTKIDIKQGIK